MLSRHRLDRRLCKLLFLVDFRGGPANSGIRVIRTQPQGAFWKVERSEQPIWKILATDAQFGPDGALWVCDWVDGWVGEGKGRVYRFFDEAAQQSEIVKKFNRCCSKVSTSSPANNSANCYPMPIVAFASNRNGNSPSAAMLAQFSRRIRDAAPQEMGALQCNLGSRTNCEIQVARARCSRRVTWCCPRSLQLSRSRRRSQSARRGRCNDL